MASNFFTGNPPGPIVKWIDENVEIRGDEQWDFDLTNIQYAKRKDLARTEQSIRLEMPDSNTLFTVDNYGTNIRKFTLTDDDISTLECVWTSDTLDIVPFFKFSADGRKLIAVKYSGGCNVMFIYEMANQYDLSGITSDAILSLTNVRSWSLARKFHLYGISSDGRKIIGGYDSGNPESWTLATPWDMTTAYWDGNDYIPDMASILGIASISSIGNYKISPDGKKMYVSQSVYDLSQGRIHVVEFEEPWNLQTLTYSGVYGTFYQSIGDFAINKSQTRIYTGDSANTYFIHQWNFV